HTSTSIEDWCARYAGQSLVVVCQSGGTASQAVAARLRRDGLDAQILEGGHDAWRELRQPLVLAAKIPPRDYEGRTVWVTRARPRSCASLVLGSSSASSTRTPSSSSCPQVKLRASPRMQQQRPSMPTGPSGPTAERKRPLMSWLKSSVSTSSRFGA